MLLPVELVSCLAAARRLRGPLRALSLIQPQTLLRSRGERRVTCIRPNSIGIVSIFNKICLYKRFARAQHFHFTNVSLSLRCSLIEYIPKAYIDSVSPFIRPYHAIFSAMKRAIFLRLNIPVFSIMAMPLRLFWISVARAAKAN